MSKIKMRLISLVFAVLLTLTCVPVFAADEDLAGLDPAHPVDLTIDYKDNGAALKDVPFRLYKVADVRRTLIMDYTEKFAEYKGTVLPNILNPKPEDGWDEMARKLNSLVVTEKIDEDITIATDADGKIEIDDLVPGLYFVNADLTARDGKIYQVTPFMLFVPTRDEDENWIYDVTVSPKYETTPFEAGSSPEVTKKITGVTPSRSESFSFTLVPDPKAEGYQSFPMPEGSANGKKTVSIQGAGTTSFGAIKFTDPGKYIYKVYEENTGIAGYTYDKTTYYLIYDVTRQDDQVAITASLCDADYNPKGEIVFTNKYTSGGLPQTGMLWWPVPVLLGAGLLFICFGVIRRRRSAK